MKHVHILSGTSHPKLAEEVATLLGLSVTPSNMRYFADGEICCQITENVRGQDVYIVHPTCPPVNDNLMELLVLIDALKRASARHITTVIPYFGYARQDRKIGPRTPITAKLVSNMIERAGADKVVTIDMHSVSLQGFFDIPVDDLQAATLFVDDVKKHVPLNESVIVSPDIGGVVRARLFAEKVGLPLAIVDKRRFAPNESAVQHVIGQVAGKHCILLDDMVDTAGTICSAAAFLMDHCAAASVQVYATHGILSGDAVARIEASRIEKVTLTNSVAFENTGKIHQVSCASLLANAVKCIATNASLSELLAGEAHNVEPMA